MFPIDILISMAPNKRYGKRNAGAKASRTAGRPLGVTVISVLGFIAGLSLVIAGIVLLAFARFGSGIFTSIVANTIPMAGTIITFLVGGAGVILLIIGTLTFLLSYGLWKMKRWGWITGMILLGIGVITDLGGLIVNPLSSTVSIIIEGIVLYYLWTNRELFK
jgi:uncharacterized membrane protein (DUF2068 family)